jgi:hypothetical protein
MSEKKKTAVELADEAIARVFSKEQIEEALEKSKHIFGFAEQLTNRDYLYGDIEFMKKILPNDYVCEARESGVHCYSEIGIKDTFSSKEIEEGKNDHWELIEKAIIQKFGDRFMEIYFQTSTNNKKFTVYIRPI